MYKNRRWNWYQVHSLQCYITRKHWHENKVINCTFTHHELYHIAFFVFWTFEIRQVWHNNHLVLIGWLEQSFLLCVPRNSNVYTSMFVFQLPVSKVGTNNSFLFGMFNKSLFTVIHGNRLNQPTWNHRTTCNTKQKLQIRTRVNLYVCNMNSAFIMVLA